MEQRIPLERAWYFRKGDEATWLAADFDPAGWDEVSLPRSNLELPYNGFDEKSYQFISTWLRDFDLEADAVAAGRRIFVDFEAVMASARVFVNGREAGGHLGGFTPFSLEISSLVRAGRNRLAVLVDSRELADVPPFGHVVDYLCYGGIYREAFVRLEDGAFVSDVFARPEAALEERKRLLVEVSLDTGGTSPEGLEIAVELSPAGADTGSWQEARAATTVPIARASAKVSTGAADGVVRLALGGLEGIAPWEPASPALYEVDVTLSRDGHPIDRSSVRVGWREAEWRPEGFFLNGRPLKILGLNRHQSWPYVGYAMPARAQRRDAEILKKELGVNLVRSSHYPPSRHFLDACDELGLLVFEELPGWQHVGGAAWKDRALVSLEEMILRDRNHPSIVLWGTRINESQDDHDFYVRTNARAKELDPSRQRGGVRYVQKSEFLEDVFTFNDFVHSGGRVVLRDPRKVTGLRREVPYLVTEYNGHMFPTKRFDQEERLAEQALRHARVLDRALGDRRIAGALGWCAFDYNTHKDFGSGDRICYHGVSDMFRLPKFAAAVYASQVDPSERLVLEAATFFAKGERSAAALLPIEVWTNCDEVVLWRGGQRVGAYLPDRASFPNLPHPPVVIRDLIGDRLEGQGFSKGDQRLVKELVAVIFSKGFEALAWHQLLRMGLMLLRKRMSYGEAEKLISRFAVGWGDSDESFELVGYVGGEEVKRRRYGGDARAERLEMAADDETILADGVDVTRVTIRLLDQYGNLHPFGAEAVQLSLEGPGEIIGPRLLPLIGGAIAFWIRSGTIEGSVVVRARGGRFEAGPVRIGVAAEPSP